MPKEWGHDCGTHNTGGEVEGCEGESMTLKNKLKEMLLIIVIAGSAGSLLAMGNKGNETNDSKKYSVKNLETHFPIEIRYRAEEIAILSKEDFGIADIGESFSGMVLSASDIFAFRFADNFVTYDLKNKKIGKAVKIPPSLKGPFIADTKDGEIIWALNNEGQKNGVFKIAKGKFEKMSFEELGMKNRNEFYDSRISNGKIVRKNEGILDMSDISCEIRMIKDRDTNRSVSAHVYEGLSSIGWKCNTFSLYDSDQYPLSQVGAIKWVSDSIFVVFYSNRFNDSYGNEENNKSQYEWIVFRISKNCDAQLVRVKPTPVKPPLPPVVDSDGNILQLIIEGEKLRILKWASPK